MVMREAAGRLVLIVGRIELNRIIVRGRAGRDYLDLCCTM